jgi:hypothetical protein
MRWVVSGGQQHIQRWGWWVALAGILLLGAFLHLYRYDNLLLPQDYDEARIYTYAYHQLRGEATLATDLIGYPPGIIWLEQALYCGVVSDNCHDDAPRTTEVLRLVQLLAGMTNLVSAVVIALLTREFAGQWAGLVAALVWLALPENIARTVMALTEAWQILAFLLVAYGAVLAFKTQQSRYALLSIAAGLLAVIFKYSAFPALGPGAAVILWHLWRYPSQRSRWLRALAVAAILIGGCAFGLLVGYGATDYFQTGEENEGGTFFSLEGNPNVELFDDKRGVPRILNTQAEQIALPTLVVWGILALGGILYGRDALTWRRLGWWLTFAFFALHLLLILKYILFWSGVMRYITPTTGLGVVLLVSSLAMLSVWLGQRFKMPQLGAVLPLIAGIVWLIAPLTQSMQTALSRALPDTHNAYIRWTESSLPTDGALLIDPQDWVYFNGSYADYAVPQRIWVQGVFSESPRAAWLEQGIRYAYLPAAEATALQSTPDGQAMFTQMLLLKWFPPADANQWRGASFGVYRLQPPPMLIDVIFGQQIQLVGFDLSATSANAGDTLTLTPFWRAHTRPERDYNLYVHLVPVDSRDVLAQADGQPGLPPRPTTTWDDAGETLIGSTLVFTLPAEIPAGEYRLIVGLYDWQTGQRLTTQTGDDFVELTRIEVKRR